MTFQVITLSAPCQSIRRALPILIAAHVMDIQAFTQVRLAGQAQPLDSALPVCIGIDAGTMLTAGQLLSAIAQHAHTCASQEAAANALRRLLPLVEHATTPLVRTDPFWLFVNGKPYTSRLWPVAPWRKLNVLIVALMPLD